jgi:unsaturated chondroitin disaccharide hydrolase
VRPANGIVTARGFADAVSAQARHLSRPATVTLLSKAAAPQSAPPSTLAPARTKTFRQAIALLRQNAESTATRFLPLLEAPGNEVSRDEGAGFFVDTDAATGEWKPYKGHYWTGGFWVGTLWQLYGETRDERFRRWAEAWNARLIGQESVQNHDIGFQGYYSSALGYERTKDAQYRASALKGAERLKALYQPEIEMVTAWGDKGNDTIIDTMMNLHIWWWASRTTGDPSWRELGRKHTHKTLAWLMRPDGSTYQSVHYNPGNDPQVFRSTRIDIDYPNTTPAGEWIFKHTHQGWSADTGWARGQAWGLYGIARAYQETGDAAFLAAARRLAAFALDRLPEDGVPWYDFHDEGVMFRNRDSSAAAILAMGLLLLADAEPERAAAAEYRTQARRIVQSLIDRYLSPVAAGDKTPPGLLQHACWTRPMNGSLVYGQYYLLEALLHLEGRGRRAR